MAGAFEDRRQRLADFNSAIRTSPSASSSCSRKRTFRLHGLKSKSRVFFSRGPGIGRQHRREPQERGGHDLTRRFRHGLCVLVAAPVAAVRPIKIDKSFVTSLLSNSQNDAIVGTILSLGRALQLPITAEGIEDDGTRDRLRLLGCSDGQGWLFGKPVSGDAIRATFGIASTPEIPSVALSDAVVSPERRDRKRRAVGKRVR